MSATRSSRTPNVRVLFNALAWLLLIPTVFSVSAVLSRGSANNVTGLITAVTDITALLFLLALRSHWFRKLAGARRAGKPELLTSLKVYDKEILKIAIFPAIGNLMMLWASELSLYLIVARQADNQLGEALLVLLFAGMGVACYFVTAKAVQSMRDKTKSGDLHHPALGVVLGSLFTVVLNLLVLFFMALVTSLPWQVVLPCVIAGGTLFAAALVVLRTAPVAKI